MRTSIADFTIPNRALSLGTVWIYEADSQGNETDILAPLYASETGSDLLKNPQDLDSSGKFSQAVYIDRPVICASQSATTPIFRTGVITPPLVGRPIQHLTADYAVTPADASTILIVTPSVAQVTILFPTLSYFANGTEITVQKAGSGASVLLQGVSAYGVSPWRLNEEGQTATVVFDGTAWRLIHTSPIYV